MTFLLLLCSMAQAVSGDELRRGVDRRVVLIDASGQQIDCALVEVQAERLVVRLQDGSLAQVPRAEVVNLIDLGPAPAPPEVEPEPEPEDDFGEAELDTTGEDDFDVENALDDLLGPAPEPGESTEPTDASEEAPDEEPVARTELPEGTLDEPEPEPEPIEPDVLAEADVAPEAEPEPEPGEASPEAAEPALPPGVTEAEPLPEDGWDDPEDATVDLGVPIPDEVAPETPARDPKADSALYYSGRADGAMAAKDGDFRAAAGLGYGLGCATACVGCTAVTVGYSVVEPTVPGGAWQSSEDVYQQGYIQSYRNTYQKEAAKRAFIGGTLGTVTFVIVATVAGSQLL